MLKYCAPTTAQLLVRLFASVWRTGRVPAEWRDGIIVSIYNGKGTMTECGSQGLITIFSVLLWKAVRGIGPPTVLLDLIQDLYTLTNSQVRFGKHLSASFRTRSGVRQGCVLAPALFCRAMDRAMPHRGVRITGENIPDSDYADDIAALLVMSARTPPCGHHQDPGEH